MKVKSVPKRMKKHNERAYNCLNMHKRKHDLMATVNSKTFGMTLELVNDVDGVLLIYFDKCGNLSFVKQPLLSDYRSTKG